MDKEKFFFLFFIGCFFSGYSQSISSSSKLEKLGNAINSPFYDANPVISPDGKTLYFSRLGDPTNKGGYDIWYSTQDENGNWLPAKNIGSPLNNAHHNTISSISPDGNSILLPYIYNSDGTTSNEKGFSISKKTDGKWSLPEKITIKYFTNKSARQSASLSNDGKILLLSIQANSGYGVEDIHVCFLQDDGTWSEPKNIGSTINTKFEELSPFLASDGVTIYFSSNGHNGLGSKDIFMSKRLDDSWKNWSKPENLGPSINSPGMEFDFVIPASGKYAYLVSIQNSNEHSDIYRVEVQKEDRPEVAIVMKGKIYNLKNKEEIPATISYQLPLSTTISTAIVSETGEYTIILPYQDKYQFIIESKNFLKTTEKIILNDTSSSQEIKKDFYLIPLEAGQSIELNNIFFERSTAKILDESYPELDRIVQLLKDNPTIKIEVGGHTDNVSKEELNIKLSQQRAEAVKKYLTSKEINSDRIKVVGYGSSKPIANNSSEETKKLNRRVEFKIIEYK